MYEYTLVVSPVFQIQTTFSFVFLEWVEVKWATVSEMNSNYFTLERSDDGIEFRSISVQKGAGNSNQTIHYIVADTEPLKGISYYRLKQTDFNGSFSYSNIAAANLSDVSTLNVFSNPTERTVELSFFSASDTNYILKIFDAKGDLVKSENYMATEDRMNSFSVNLSILNSGLYFITLSNATELLKAAVIKK